MPILRIIIITMLAIDIGVGGVLSFILKNIWFNISVVVL